MRIFKRFISLFMVLSIVIGSFAMINVSAAEIKGSLTREKYLAGYYFKFSASNNYRANGHYGQPSIWKVGSKYCYCIELGVSTLSGVLTASNSYSLLDRDERDQLKYAMIYGYDGSTKYGKTKEVEYYATQIICWAISEGRLLSNSNFNTLVNESLNKCPDESDVREVVTKIREQIKKHRTIPSFTGDTASSARTRTLHWNGKKFTATLTDKNGVLNQYHLWVRENGTWKDSNFSNISVSKSGSNLTLSMTQKQVNNMKADSRFLIRLTRVKGQYTAKADYKDIDAYFVTDGKNTGKSGGQDMILAYNQGDPVNSYLKLDATTLGSLKIKKVSTDNYGGLTANWWSGGQTETGIWFNVTGPNNYNKSFATDSSHEINLKDLPYGTYTIRELWDGAGHYYAWGPQTVTINATSPSVEVEALNWEKWRGLKIQKTTPNNQNLDGWIFRVTGNDSITGASVNFEGVTNSDGVIYAETTGYNEITANWGVNDVAIRPGTYKVEEVGRWENGVRKSIDDLTADGWCTPQAQWVTVNYGSIGYVNFKNEVASAVHLYKSSDAKDLSYTCFHVVGGEGTDEYVYTDNYGRIDMTFTLDGREVNGKKTYKPGTYTFEEIFLEDDPNEMARYYGEDFVKPEKQDITITSDDVENRKVKNIYFKNKFKANKLHLIKISDDGVVEGFRFKVTLIKSSYIDVTATENGEVKYLYQYNAVTDENGEFLIDGENAETLLPPGTYEIEELDTPFRYRTPQKVTVEVGKGKTSTVQFRNLKKYGQINLKKLDSETGKQIVDDNTQFKLLMWSEEEKDYIDAYEMQKNEETNQYEKTAYKFIYSNILKAYSVVSDNKTMNKRIAITDDNLGKFKIIETHAPNGYVLSDKEFDVTIENEQTTTLYEDIYNTPQKVKVALWKVAQGQNKSSDDDIVKSYNSIAGAEFNIYAKEDIIVNNDIKYKAGDLVDKITTIEGDWAYSNINLYLGKYEIVETKAPDGYVLDTMPREINLEYQGQDVDVWTQYVTIENIPQMATITVSKYGELLKTFAKDEETGINVAEYEKTLLNNAEFSIYAKEDIIVNGELMYKQGDLVDKITTTDEGKGKSKPLYLGKYEVIETKAPDGFVRCAETFDVTLEYQGQEKDIFNTDMSVDNTRQKFEINLTKTIEQNENYPNENAFKDVEFRVFSAGDIKNYKGEIVLKQGDLVDIFGIDENGNGKSTADLPIGKYYIKETKTAQGWVLPDKEYSFELSPGDDLKDVIIINLNEEYGEIKNVPIKVIVNLSKQSSESKKFLANAVYGIYRASDDKLIEKLETDKNGKAQSGLLPYGEYYIKELIAPQNFQLDENKYEFSANELKEFINFSLEDAPIEDAPIPDVVGKIDLNYREKGGGSKIYYDYPGSPQTDDFKKNIALGIFVAVVSGSIAIISGKKRKKVGGKK